MKTPEKIISGGQTGVDQAALDYALMQGITCGGWCPPGRECETGRIPDKYPLREVEVPDYNERTRRNIMDSDATLVITAGGRMEQGTQLTLEWAKELNRPLHHIQLEGREEPPARVLVAARSWLSALDPAILNVAGNRESTSPGIGASTVRILERLFGSGEH
jgi:hypothetical protein